jgi:hypothetical protein
MIYRITGHFDLSGTITTGYQSVLNATQQCITEACLKNSAYEITLKLK